MENTAQQLADRPAYEAATATVRTASEAYYRDGSSHLTDADYDGLLEAIAAAEATGRVQVRTQHEVTDIERGADVTVPCVEVPRLEATGFGVMHVDEDDRIVSFLEKPADPPAIPGKPDRALASMGIYVFNARFLYDQLRRDAADPASSHAHPGADAAANPRPLPDPPPSPSPHPAPVQPPDPPPRPQRGPIP